MKSPAEDFGAAAATSDSARSDEIFCAAGADFRSSVCS
jgi:hypothetical protein